MVLRIGKEQHLLVRQLVLILLKRCDFLLHI
jgi:hypothetical protein